MIDVLKFIVCGGFYFAGCLLVVDGLRRLYK